VRGLRDYGIRFRPPEPTLDSWRFPRMKQTVCSAALLALILCSTAWGAVPQPIVVYAFDQDIDALLEIADTNDDGDTLDPGEVLTYFDNTPPGTGLGNAQGLALFGRRDVLATDNVAPQNVVRLRDLNDDGDAFDEGEAAVWFQGDLPNGYSLVTPVGLTIGASGEQYLIDTPYPPDGTPQAIYRMEDANADGDVDDGGEVSVWLELAGPSDPQIAIRDLEFDDQGHAFYLDAYSPEHHGKVMRIETATMEVTTYLDSDVLLGLTGNLLLCQTWGKGVVYKPQTGELIVSAYYGVATDVLIAVVDRDGSGAIDQMNEVRPIWNQATPTHDPNIDEARDLCLLPDGSLLWLCNGFDRLWRLFDRNEDLDYDDQNEQILLYDADDAQGAGQPVMHRPLTVAGVLTPAADAGDGTGSGRTALAIGSFPNPSSDRATVTFYVPLSGHGRLDIFDAAGRRMGQIFEGYLTAGSHRTTWEWANGAGHPLGCGVYYCRLETGDGAVTSPLVRVRR
jgi:hypothetical protein